MPALYGVHVHIDRIETIQRKFVRFTLGFLGWRTDIALPPYCNRCNLLDLDCSSVLSRLNLLISRYNARHNYFGNVQIAPTMDKIDQPALNLISI
jgi:hypothetical protein